MNAGIPEWFAARIPDHWGIAGVEVVADQDEILVVVDLPGSAPGAGHDHAQEGLTGIRRFRETTRDERIALAGDAEQAWRRKVSWGARAGEVVVIFTTASVPVMTRLRLPERQVLDTLIDAGVARSRSEALAWCVRLVGDNEKEWIGELRTAFKAVAAARERGPRSSRDGTPSAPAGASEQVD
ncbi:MAG TPA: hypothetical protein VGL49_01750 [Acidimicrobiales bacterium]